MLAYISIGSNLGDRLANLVGGLQVLLANQELELTRVSSVYETAPWGKTDQPEFLNACAGFRTRLAPGELLKRCQAAEMALHRQRREHWGPRTLDVDIVLFENRQVSEPDLVIPHPRLAERAFVIIPLLELNPTVTLPDGGKVADLLPGVQGQGIWVATPAAEFLQELRRAQERSNGC